MLGPGRQVAAPGYGVERHVGTLPPDVDADPGGPRMAHTTKPIAARKGDEPALIDDVGETTWAALDDRVNRLINALRAAGLGTGDTIALMSGNRAEFFEVTVAAMHGGW